VLSLSLSYLLQFVVSIVLTLHSFSRVLGLAGNRLSMLSSDILKTRPEEPPRRHEILVQDISVGNGGLLATKFKCPLTRRGKKFVTQCKGESVYLVEDTGNTLDCSGIFWKLNFGKGKHSLLTF
jgi:hypothetical protein